MHRLIWILMSAFFYTISSFNSYAAIKVVNKVYRIDDRNMNEINRVHGFYPRDLSGNESYDDDLSHHFEGESVVDGVSPFVSTTSELGDAVRHAASLARPNEEEPFDPEFETYIYDIIPGSNFYDLEGSFRAALEQSTPFSERHIRLTRLLNEFGGMHEYVALQGFSNNRIQRYARITGRMLANDYSSGRMFNPNYWVSHWETNHMYSQNNRNDRSNAGPYRSISVIPRGDRVVVGNGTQVLPASFSCYGIDRNNNHSKFFSTKEKYLLPTSGINPCTPYFMGLKHQTYYDKLRALIY